MESGRQQQTGMRWSRLIVRAGLADGWTGRDDPLVRAVVEDSRQAGPGACFVASRGTRSDGHDFIPAAVQAGACAVVSERPWTSEAAALTGNPGPGPVNLVLPGTRGVAGRLAAVLHGLDELQARGGLKLVGITGTNGKSTFCYLMRGILQAAGWPAAMLGTIEYDLISRKVQAPMTTPPATALVGYLAEAAQAGASHAVMEVSSHALDQGRCEGLRFAVGVFSNLTGDHLDYHRDMQSYLLAKKRLFDGLEPSASAVANLEDPAWRGMVADCRARVIGYGVLDGSGPANRPPALRARITEMTASGTRFELAADAELKPAGPITRVEVSTPLVGRHNVQNCLAAATAALALGIPLETVAAGLASVDCVPGRLQRVTVKGANGRARPVVLVDYAHTDDALANVLSALRPLTPGRLILMFGCGGDRDRSKRPRMARVASRWADRVVITSDNPRTEEPHEIIREILAGVAAEHAGRVRVQPDRRRAIAEAIRMADAGDVVLLAGKGHENYQIIGEQRLPFDDLAIAGEILETI